MQQCTCKGPCKGCKAYHITHAPPELNLYENLPSFLQVCCLSAVVQAPSTFSTTD